MNRRVFAAVILFSTLAGAAGTVQAQTVTDERVWFSLPVQGHIGSEESLWRWSMETVMRSRNGIDELDTLTLRPSVTYNVTSRASVSGGYALVTGFPVTGGTLTEHRVHGQFVWTQPGSAGTLTLRTRIENRWIETNSGPIGRLRQQIRFSRPLRQGARMSIVGSDELIVHLNDTSRIASGVEQNRAFAGISTAMTPVVRVEVGYLNQYLPGHRGVADRMNHVLSSSMAISF